jgi:glycosyltransferase involved in cell wall biosynthesis
MNKLQIIAPSKFMVIEAAKSYNLKFQKVEFIPNKFAVDLSVDRDASSKLKLGNDFIIGIASAKPREVLKGGDLIFELSNTIIKDNLQLSLLYLKDFPQSEQNEFWEQIDCLLVPSRGDNSPNVIHEAKFFNIPVIATNVGGIPELLFSSFDILLDVKSISVQDILQAIFQIKSQNISNEAILQMRNFYDSYTLNSITNLVKIYEKLIESI